jgi:hypothetical protein
MINRFMLAELGTNATSSGLQKWDGLLQRHLARKSLIRHNFSRYYQLSASADKGVRLAVTGKTGAAGPFAPLALTMTEEAQWRPALKRQSLSRPR